MDEDGTHVARRVASLEQASPVITAMLIDAFGVANPRPFQVDGIYALAYLSANLLVVQKTGAGKSLVPLGAAALMGGVTYIIEPLVTVGDDQASSANRQASAAGVRAFHLDGLHGESKAKLIKFLLSMTSRDDGPVLLYASPQSMGPGYPWHDVLVHLLEKGLVTLLGIDEVHKALRDGLEFRPDFRKLKTTFWSLASLSPVPIAKLSMTATLPLDSRALYLEMMGLPHFSHVIHGDVSRLDVLMYATVSATSTQLAKALCEEHLLVPKRKVIVFTSNASAAEASLTDAFKRVIEAAPLITGDVVSLTGRTANIRKAHIMNALASDQRSPALDLRVAVMTAAGECGFNAPRCGLVIELGLPENIDALAQHLGRAGRRLLSPGEKPYAYHVVLSLGHLTFLFTRISHSDSHSSRTRQLSEAIEVLRLIVFPPKCIYVYLAERYGDTRTRPRPTGAAEEEDVEAAGSGDCAPHDPKFPGVRRCWHCRQRDTIRINRGVTIDVLDTNAFQSADKKACLATAVVDVLYKNASDVWVVAGFRNPTKADSAFLVMQLIAAKIVAFDIIEYPGSQRHSNLVLSWAKKPPSSALSRETMAWRDSARWDDIKHED